MSIIDFLKKKEEHEKSLEELIKDENVKGENNPGGAFVGFVLLADERWNLENFRYNLLYNWGIQCDDHSDDDDLKQSLVFLVDDMTAAVSLIPAPIPDGEAEQNAQNNFMWEHAVETTAQHKAHIMVAVLGEGSYLERAKLLVKLISTCCQADNVLGIYSSGTVFEPSIYMHYADMMNQDLFPIYNLIWFGLYQNENGVSAYTYGMNAFGKDEMEVLETNLEPADLYDFISTLASYVIEYDVTLHDGETIGLTEEQICPITRGPGISLSGMTIKIEYYP